MNAKTEFLEEIEGKTLICARIKKDYYGDENTWIILKDNYTPQDLINFCNQLDFEYDSGFGGQELFGLILFSDSYSDRGEYDGSEWWNNHKMPTIEAVVNPK